MNFLRTSIASAVLAAGLVIGSQAQATLSISINGSTVASDATNTLATYSSAGTTWSGFNVNDIRVSGASLFTNGQLIDVGALDISSTGVGSGLAIRVTETGLTVSALKQIFNAAFSSTLTNVSVTRSFYLDATNSGASSVLLASTSRSVADGPFAEAFNISSPLETLSGLFSITEEIIVSSITSGKSSTMSSDDALAAAVPEPASLSLLGFGLLGVAGLARRRRRSL